MRQTITILLAFMLTGALSGCGRSCEDIQDDIMEISREIQKKPETAWDRGKELEALKNELEETGCLATGP